MSSLLPKNNCNILVFNLIRENLKLDDDVSDKEEIDKNTKLNSSIGKK